MFELEEVESAFRHYWYTGMIREDWNAWADLFTEDVDRAHRSFFIEFA